MTTHRRYVYVGPNAIKELLQQPAQRFLICQPDDIRIWIKETEQSIDRDHTVVATFILNTNQELWIADRRSEHIVCARGADVFSAGEITFVVTEDDVEVIEVTNQSTGYCPEPESWWAVSAALEKATLRHPSDFTTSFLFRRCDQCGTTNIVKDMWFECAVCEAPLDHQWNYAKTAN
jgi:hypothetical protein